MPVFSRLREGVLEVIVDGDFTSGELDRAGGAALGGDGLPSPVPVLLDMSGAAGLDGKTEDELRAAVSVFTGSATAIGRLALLATPAAALTMEGAADQAGLDARPFGTRADALSWLKG